MINELYIIFHNTIISLNLENIEGLQEVKKIPEAIDPKNKGLNYDEYYPIYYFIESKNYDT